MYDTATPFIAAFMILRKGDKILCVLRSGTGWMDGKYGLPAGKVEKDEPYSLCAVREVKEEVGISVKPDEMQYVHTMHRRSEDSDWVDVYFEATKWEGEPLNAEPDKHSEVAWLGINNLPDNMVPPVKHAILEIEKGNTYSEYGWKD